MNKFKNNVTSANQTMIDVLKQNIKKEILNQDTLVDIKNLYVLFTETNSFRICEEMKKEGPGCTTYELNDFFTDYLTDFVVIHKIDQLVIPWRKNDEFSLLGGEKAIAIPVKNFLGKNVLNNVTTKKNIISLYKVLTDYLKENPNFIDSMFIEKTKKKQI